MADVQATRYTVTLDNGFQFYATKVSDGWQIGVPPVDDESENVYRTFPTFDEAKMAAEDLATTLNDAMDRKQIAQSDIHAALENL